MGALAIVPLVASAVGTAVQLGNAAQQGAARATEANWNAALGRSAEADALQRGAQTAGRLRTQTSQLIAKQRVAYANSGVELTSGTALDVSASTRMIGELDAKTAENNAAREAWGLKTQASLSSLQADIYKQRATNEMAGLAIGGLGRLAAQGASLYGDGK